jgi:arylsulfatase A-like enzyme
MAPETQIAQSDRVPMWRWLAGIISPNPRVFLMIVVGSAVELTLLACVRDSIYDVSRETRLLAVEFTVWFWVTVGWVLWLAASRLRHLWARVAWVTLLAFVLVVYALSWGVYLHTSRFLDWDAARFTVGNFHLLWMYARQAERGAVFATLATLTAVGAAVLCGGPWLACGQWFAGDKVALRRWRRVAWQTLALGWLLLLLASRNSNDLSQIGRSQDAVRNCLHPAATLVTSCLSLPLREQIVPCLKPSDLRPLAEGEAWNRNARVTNRANVVLITVESMRYDVVGLRQQGQEVMPVVNALAHDGVHFIRAYSQTTHTDYSTASLYSSLFPLRTVRHLYFHANDPWPKTLLYDLLRPAGYATAIISSQNEGWGGMDNFLKTPQLDLFYDPERSDPSAHAELTFDNLPDAQTVDKAIAWIARQAETDRPFFVGLNLQTSHFPYKLPPGTDRPFQPGTIDFPAEFLEYPQQKVTVVRNAYYNSLHECDRQIGRLVQALRANGQWAHTIIVVAGDHGEAFYDQGYVSHAREPIESVIRTACLLCAPGKITPHVDDYPVELIDILPTVLGLLGLPPHPDFQGIDVLSSGRPPLDRRFLFFHVENPISRCDAVLWGGRWKYLHDRLRGTESLFDVQTDPGEANDLCGRRPQLADSLRRVLATWRRRQLAYYRFPMYYERYFPPAPPATPAS